MKMNQIKHQLLAKKKECTKKGQWETATGIDDISENSDFDNDERLDDLQQTECLIEARKFLQNRGVILYNTQKH